MDAIALSRPTISAEIQDWIDRGKTLGDIALILRRQHPSVTRGLSARSLRRYCHRHAIGKRKGPALDSVVSACIRTVGYTYGRRMMKGHLAAQGVQVCESRISQSLQRLCPDAHEARRSNTIDRVNPVRYQANYFGHKLHVDQNEKLIEYGVTHVVARDGYSGKIVGYLTLPIKNNLAIYEEVFRKAVCRYGLWDQVRVDHGREFYLLLFIQEHLRKPYGARHILPYVQSRSVENSVIERIWPEVNHRVNYTLKRKVIEMVKDGQINLDHPHAKFCVSHILVNVSGYGLKLFVEAWNLHHITGKGVPTELERRRYGTTVLPQSLIPSSVMAESMYIQQGGRLTNTSVCGLDPLRNRRDLVLRRGRLFSDRNHPYEDIYSNVSSGNGQYLKNAILTFINLTQALQQLL